MDKLNKLTTLLQRLNNYSKIKLITKKDLSKVEKNIKGLQLHFDKFMKLIEDEKNLNDQDDIKQVIVHLYREIGNIVQEFENLHELITLVAQRYGNYLKVNDE